MKVVVRKYFPDDSAKAESVTGHVGSGSYSLPVVHWGEFVQG